VKIIQILPELNSGGVELCVMEIAACLVRNGHTSIVISNGGRLAKELEASGSRHICMPVHAKRLSSLLQIPRLRSLFRQEKPDIIHPQSRMPAWLSYLAWKSMPETRKPSLVTTVHGFHSVNPYSAIMTKGENVICVSRSIKEHILNDYKNTVPNKLHVIYGGVDTAFHHPNYQPPTDWLNQWHKQNPHLVGKKTLLLPGRITRLKGHQEFLSLIHGLLKNGVPVHGIIVGDTHPKKRSYLAELQILTKQLQLEDHVSFLGHRSDLRNIIAVTDLSFSLSRQPEAFGRTVLEAVALGQPVIGHSIGGVNEILSACYPRGLVAPNDHETLVKTTCEILDNRSIPSKIPVEFTLPAMSAATLALYESRCK
jgi:glycosyltransferase involved in cell wall biosynthesis